MSSLLFFFALQPAVRSNANLFACGFGFGGLYSTDSLDFNCCCVCVLSKERRRALHSSSQWWRNQRQEPNTQTDCIDTHTHTTRCPTSTQREKPKRLELVGCVKSAAGFSIQSDSDCRTVQLSSALSHYLFRLCQCWPASLSLFEPLQSPLVWFTASNNFIFFLPIVKRANFPQKF